MPISTTFVSLGDLLASDAASELLALLAEGRADAEAGRTRPAASVIEDLRERILA